jgi:hypothetical protein
LIPLSIGPFQIHDLFSACHRQGLDAAEHAPLKRVHIMASPFDGVNSGLGEGPFSAEDTPQVRQKTRF